MKKSIVALVVTVLLAATLLTACGGEKTYYNIAAQSNPYSMGKQSITIEASSYNYDEPAVEFKQTIAASDIVLGDALVGKTVTNVVYNGKTSITVTLEGNTRTAGGESVYGTITVKHSGLESEGNSSCMVNVRAPEVMTSRIYLQTGQKGDVKTYSLKSTLSMPAGEFLANITDEGNVTLVDATGEMTVELSEGNLIVTINKCSVDVPTICIKDASNSFGKDITVELDIFGSVPIK